VLLRGASFLQIIEARLDEELKTGRIHPVVVLLSPRLGKIETGFGPCSCQ